MLSTKKKRYTYKDYQELPEGAPYQLINGDLVMTPARSEFSFANKFTGKSTSIVSRAADTKR